MVIRPWQGPQRSLRTSSWSNHHGFCCDLFVCAVGAKLGEVRRQVTPVTNAHWAPAPATQTTQNVTPWSLLGSEHPTMLASWAWWNALNQAFPWFTNKNKQKSTQKTWPRSFWVLPVAVLVVGLIFWLRRTVQNIDATTAPPYFGVRGV